MANLITNTEADRASSGGILATKNTAPPIQPQPNVQPQPQPQPSAAQGLGAQPQPQLDTTPAQPQIVAQAPPATAESVMQGAAGFVPGLVNKQIDLINQDYKNQAEVGRQASQEPLLSPDNTIPEILPVSDFAPLFAEQDRQANNEVAVSKAKTEALIGNPLESVFSGNNMPFGQFGGDSNPPGYFNPPVPNSGKGDLWKASGIPYVLGQLAPVQKFNPAKMQFGEYGQGMIGGAMYALDLMSAGAIIKGGLSNYYQLFQDAKAGKKITPGMVINPEVKYKHMYNAMLQGKQESFFNAQSDKKVGLMVPGAGWWNTLIVPLAFSLEALSSPANPLGVLGQLGKLGNKVGAVDNVVTATSKVASTIDKLPIPPAPSAARFPGAPSLEDLAARVSKREIRLEALAAKVSKREMESLAAKAIKREIPPPPPPMEQLAARNNIQVGVESIEVPPRPAPIGIMGWKYDPDSKTWFRQAGLDDAPKDTSGLPLPSPSPAPAAAAFQKGGTIKSPDGIPPLPEQQLSLDKAPQPDPGVPLQMGTQRPGQPALINPEVPPAGAAMEDLTPKPVGQPLPELSTGLPERPPGQVDLAQPPEGAVQPMLAGANPTSMDYQFNNALQMGKGEGHSLFLGGGSRPPKEGFLVATGQADAIPLDYTPEDLSNVLNKKMTEALDDPAIISVGAQKVGNEYKFETSYLFDNEKDALEYATQTGQKSVYNYATNISTPVPELDIQDAFSKAAANLPEPTSSFLKEADFASVSPAESIAAGRPEVMVQRSFEDLTTLASELGYYTGTGTLTPVQLRELNLLRPGVFGTYGKDLKRALGDNGGWVRLKGQKKNITSTVETVDWDKSQALYKALQALDPRHSHEITAIARDAEQSGDVLKALVTRDNGKIVGAALYNLDGNELSIMHISSKNAKIEEQLTASLVSAANKADVSLIDDTPDGMLGGYTNRGSKMLTSGERAARYQELISTQSKDTERLLKNYHTASPVTQRKLLELAGSGSTSVYSSRGLSVDLHVEASSLSPDDVDVNVSFSYGGMYRRAVDKADRGTASKDTLAAGQRALTKFIKENPDMKFVASIAFETQDELKMKMRQYGHYGFTAPPDYVYGNLPLDRAKFNKANNRGAFIPGAFIPGAGSKLPESGTVRLVYTGVPSASNAPNKMPSYEQWLKMKNTIQARRIQGLPVDDLVKNFANTPVPPPDMRYLREALFTTAQKGVTDEQLLKYFQAAQDVADHSPNARMLSQEVGKLQRQLDATDNMIKMVGADPEKYLDAPHDYDSLVSAFNQASADVVANPNEATHEMYLLTKAGLERHILDNMQGHLTALEDVVDNAVGKVNETFEQLRMNGIPAATNKARLSNVYVSANDVSKYSAQGTSDLISASNAVDPSAIAATTLVADQAVRAKLAIASVNLQPQRVGELALLRNLAWKFQTITGTKLTQVGQIYDVLRGAQSTTAQAIKEALVVPAVMTDIHNSQKEIAQILKPFVGTDRAAINNLMMSAYDAANANKYLQTLGEQSINKFGELVVAKNTLDLAEARYFAPWRELAASHGLDEETTKLVLAYGAKIVNTWDDAHNYLTAVGLGNKAIQDPWFLSPRAIEQVAKLPEAVENAKFLDDLLPIAKLEPEWGAGTHKLASEVLKVTPDELSGIMYEAPTVLAKKVEQLDQASFDLLMDTGTLGKMPTSTTHLAEQVIKRLNLEGEFKDLGEFMLVNPDQAMKNWASTMADAAAKEPFNAQMADAAVLDGWAFKNAAEAPAGFVQARTMPNGLYFHPDVAGTIDIIHEMDKPHNLGWFASAMQVIKRQMLATGAFVVKNALGNTFQYVRAGGDPSLMANQLTKHFAELNGRGLQAYDDTVKAFAKGTMTEREAVRAYLQSGNGNDVSLFYSDMLLDKNPATYKGWTPETIKQHTGYLINDLLRTGSVPGFGRDLLKIGNNLSNDAVWVAMIGAESVEGGLKKALFLSILRDERKGGDLFRSMVGSNLPEFTTVDDATNYIAKYFYNYTDKGRADRSLSTYVFPFWQYFSRNLTGSLYNAINHPGQIVNTWRLYTFANSLSGATSDPMLNDLTVDRMTQKRMPLFFKTGTDENGKSTYFTLPLADYDQGMDGINTMLNYGRMALNATGMQTIGTPTERRETVFGREVGNPLPFLPLDSFVQMLHPTWKIAVQGAEVAMGKDDFITGKKLSQPGTTIEGRKNSFLGVEMPPWMSTMLGEAVPMLRTINAVNPGDVFGTSEYTDAQGNLKRDPTKAFGGLGAYRTDRDARNSMGRLSSFMGVNMTPLDTAINAQKSIGDMTSMHYKLVQLIRRMDKDAQLTTVPQPQKDRLKQELMGVDYAIMDGIKRVQFWADQNHIPTKKARELMIRNNILVNDLPEAPADYQPTETP